MDQDEGIKLVVDDEKDVEVEGRHADKQAEIYNIDLDHSSKNAALNHVQSKEPQYIKRYHGIKKKPQTESEARKNMISYLKNTEDEDDDVFVEAIPLTQNVPVMDYQIVVIDNKPKYPLSRFTLEQLVNVARLQVKEESEMSLELLRFTRQQLQEYQQSNVDAARLKLKLFKDAAAIAYAKVKDPLSKGPPQCSWWYPKSTPSGYIWKPKSEKENVNPNLVEIVLFIVDYGCSKHMTRNLKLLINFVEKFLGTVKFGNDQIVPILGYGDLVQGAITIKRVYYVEGLNHNLLSVG
nr:integrase, catalytic region, zinc finger, CCHC-type, peptidase aspartic, catalytic [Tanacetum cinerariifolium]